MTCVRARDPALQLLGLPLQAVSTARPAGRAPRGPGSRGTDAARSRRRSRSISASCRRRPSSRPARGGRGQVVAGQLVAHGRGQVPAVLGRPRAEPVRDPHPVDGRDRHREVGQRQPLDLAALGEHERPRAAPCRAGRRTRAPARRRPAARPGTWMMSPRRSFSSDAAASACRAAERCRACSPSRWDSSRRMAWYSAKSPRSQLTPRARSMDCLICARLAGQADHRPVGLELGEGRLQQRRGPRACRPGRPG